MSHLNRRDFLATGLAFSLPLQGAWDFGTRPDRMRMSPDLRSLQQGTQPTPTHSIIPITGDGRWVSREAPNETGLLEPREYEVRIGIEATGRISARNFVATTVAPIEHPEQKILDVRVEQDGCAANIQNLSETAAQLVVSAPLIADKQAIRGEAIYRIRLCKTHWGYARDRFPEKQSVSKEIARQYLNDSPGIEIRLAKLRKIVEEASLASTHPWDLANAFYQWVHTKIEGIPMSYTSVKRAIETLRGDCEERAGVFVALCRTAGIPARLVWLPNHAWAEFLLVDESGQAHWIPAHTAAYTWFGWTGVHELVLQKGDKIKQTGMDKYVRLVSDWWQYEGTKPNLRFTASITPLPPETQTDPGPGARQKQPAGQWKLVGTNPDQRYMRD